MKNSIVALSILIWSTSILSISDNYERKEPRPNGVTRIVGPKFRFGQQNTEISSISSGEGICKLFGFSHYVEHSAIHKTARYSQVEESLTEISEEGRYKRSLPNVVETPGGRYRSSAAHVVQSLFCAQDKLTINTEFDYQKIVNEDGSFIINNPRLFFSPGFTQKIVVNDTEQLDRLCQHAGGSSYVDGSLSKSESQHEALAYFDPKLSWHPSFIDGSNPVQEKYSINELFCFSGQNDEQNRSPSTNYLGMKTDEHGWVIIDRPLFGNRPNNDYISEYANKNGVCKLFGFKEAGRYKIDKREYPQFDYVTSHTLPNIDSSGKLSGFDVYSGNYVRYISEIVCRPSDAPPMPLTKHDEIMENDDGSILIISPKLLQQFEYLPISKDSNVSETCKLFGFSHAPSDYPSGFISVDRALMVAADGSIKGIYSNANAIKNMICFR